MRTTKLNLRFIVAVVASTAIIIVVCGYNAFEYYSPGAYGNWIVRYRTPLEIMISTTLGLAGLAWLYHWYRRDRVAHAYAMLDAEERVRLLDKLLAQRYDELLREELADGGKRKRVEAEAEAGNTGSIEGEAVRRRLAK